MQVINNSTTKTYTLGGYAIGPGVQRFIPDDYYPDMNNITDLQVVGKAPAVPSRQSVVPLYGLVNTNGRINKAVTESGRMIQGLINDQYFLASRVVLLGDSNMAFGYEEVPISGKPAKSITNRAIIDVANARIRQKMNIVKRAGVGGDRFDNMLARFNTDVAPYNPTMVVLQGGGNNLDQFWSAQQTFDSVVEIHKACQDIGAFLVFVNTTGRPRDNNNTTPSPIDGLVYKQSQEYPRFANIARDARKYLPDYKFYDMSQAIRDYGSSVNAGNAAFGAVLANTMADPSHVSPYGALLSATSGLDKFFDKIFDDIYPDTLAGGGYSTSGDQAQLTNGNPLMMGSGGTFGTGVSGVLPDPIFGSRTGGTITAVCAMVPRTDGGAGRMAQVAISGSGALTEGIRLGANGNYPANAPLPGSGVEAYFQATVEVVSVTSGALHNVTGEIIFYGPSSVVLGTATFGTVHSPSSGVVANEGYTGLTGPINFGLLRTPRFAVPEGTVSTLTRLTLYTTVGAQLTVNVADYGSRVAVEEIDNAKYRTD